MKKHLFLSLFLLTAAFAFSQIAPDGIFLPIDSTLATDSSLTLKGRNVSNADFFVRSMHRDSGSNTSFQFDTLIYKGAGVTNFNYDLNHLQPAKTFEVALIFYNDSLTDSLITTSQFGTTKVVPPSPVQASVTNAHLVPMIGHSMIIFNYSSVGYSNTAVAEFAPNFSPSAYATTISGVGTDTIYIPTTANQTIPAGVIYFSPIGNVSGVHSGISNEWSQIMVPNYTKPGIHLTNISHGQQSAAASVVIDSVGNSGSMTLVTYFKKSGTVLLPTNSQQVTNLATIPFSKSGLLPDSNYVFVAIATGPGGSDTVTCSYHLDPMDLPQVSIVNSPTSTQHSYSVPVFINPVDTFSLATIVKIYLQENGILKDSIMGTYSDTATVTFNETGKSSGTTYSDYVIVKNLGGHTASTSQFSVLTKTPAPPRTETPPTVSNIWSGPSSTTVDISFTVNVGDTVRMVTVYSQAAGSSVIDSQVIAQYATTGSVIYGFLFDNQLGYTDYCYWATTYSGDNVAAVGAKICQLTSNSINPSLVDVTQPLPIPDDSLIVVFHGNGGGNPCNLLYWLTTESNSGVGDSRQVPVGSGDITYRVSWGNLSPNTWYTVHGQLSLTNGNYPSPITKSFKTGGVSAVNDLKMDGSSDCVFVNVINVLGQQIMTHTEFGKARTELPKGQLFIIQPFKEDGTLGEAQKFVFTE